LFVFLFFNISFTVNNCSHYCANLILTLLSSLKASIYIYNYCSVVLSHFQTNNTTTSELSWFFRSLSTGDGQKQHSDLLEFLLTVILLNHKSGNKSVTPEGFVISLPVNYSNKRAKNTN